VPVSWGSVKGALALRVRPRLAMREAVGAGGSTIASSYGIAFTMPTSWKGSVDRNTGGWAVATTGTAITLPDGACGIAGSAAKAGTPARDLLEAIRGPASAAWTANGGGPAQLQQCALAPLFDPSTWVLPADELELRPVADRIHDEVWRAGRPAYADLVELSLQELLQRTLASTASRVLEDIRAGLRSELLRRYLVEPELIPAAGLTEEQLGARALGLFAEVEGFGKRRFPVDLFLLLELGVVSLSRRVAEEEHLPAMIEREWTPLCATGRYEVVVTPTPIDVEALGVEASAKAINATVAAESITAGLNQAGEHLDGFLQTRSFDLDVEPGARPGPATFTAWTITAERDRAFAGLRFRGTLSASGVSSDCVLTFAEADEGLRLTLAYMGSEKTLLRPRSLARVITRGEDQVAVPLSEPIKPFMNDVELAALSPKVREIVEASERYWPTAAETALLEKIVERLVADMEYVASGPEAVRPSRMTTLCERFSAAFSYFYRRVVNTGRPGKQISLARAFVRDRLVAMPGDGSPFDEWISPNFPPSTYWQALAIAAGWAQTNCLPIVDRLGLGVVPLVLDPDEDQPIENIYSYRKESRGPVGGVLGDPLMKTPLGKPLEWLFEKGLYALTKIDGANYGLGPDVTFDLVRAEFKKKGPYPPQGQPDPHGWPGTAANPGIVNYVGAVAGGGVAWAGGMNLDYSEDWSDINTGLDPWTPQDFAGWVIESGFTGGWTAFGVEALLEPPAGWIWGHVFESVNSDNMRSMGEFTYEVFLPPDPPPDREAASVWSFTFIDGWGLWVGITLTTTVAYLWLGTDIKLVDPSVLAAPGTLTADAPADTTVCFEVGRSELTASGKGLLRRTAALHLHALATPTTSLKVVGHASPDDARALYNQTLSERRAANVVRYLRGILGPLFAVPDERAVSWGVGDQQAREEGGPPAGWRRVDLTINGKVALRMTAL
jgi:outer membrane protein OmpA-like peptidoglycan-associated protein